MDKNSLLFVNKKMTDALCEQMMPLSVRFEVHCINIYTEENQSDKSRDFFKIQIQKPLQIDKISKEIIPQIKSIEAIISEIDVFEAFILHFIATQYNLPFFLLHNSKLIQIPTRQLTNNELKILKNFDLSLKTMTITELAEMNDAAMPTISHSVQPLLAQGIMQTERMLTDRRQRNYSLTELGQIAQSWVQPSPSRSVEIQMNPKEPPISDFEQEIMAQTNIIGIHKLLLPLIDDARELKEFQDKLLKLEIHDARELAKKYFRKIERRNL